MTLFQAFLVVAVAVATWCAAYFFLKRTHRAMSRAEAGQRSRMTHLDTVAGDEDIALFAWNEHGTITRHDGGGLLRRGVTDSDLIGHSIEAMFEAWGDPVAVGNLAAVRAGYPGRLTYITTGRATDGTEETWRVSLRADAERPGAGFGLALDITGLVRDHRAEVAEREFRAAQTALGTRYPGPTDPGTPAVANPDIGLTDSLTRAPSPTDPASA